MEAFRREVGDESVHLGAGGEPIEAGYLVHAGAEPGGLLGGHRRALADGGLRLMGGGGNKSRPSDHQGGTGSGGTEEGRRLSEWRLRD